MKEGIEALNAITEVVLAYRPPGKKKKSKQAAKPLRSGKSKTKRATR